jgi:hypothetical protein
MRLLGYLYGNSLNQSEEGMTGKGRVRVEKLAVEGKDSSGGPNSLILVILPAYPAYEDGTECSETSTHKIQRPVITQKKKYIIQNTAEV